MSTTHLLVLVHGMWGNAAHLEAMARTITEAYDRKAPTIDGNRVDLHVLLAHTNAEGLTYDGIDNGGERVAEEVLLEIDKLKGVDKPVTRISVCGYSLGGLIARYLIGILHQRNFFDTVTPVNFYAFASPHCGLPRYPTIPSKVAFFMGPKFLARTGRQFFLQDKWGSDGRPLLTVMADPERVFYKGLRQFSHVTVYANAVYDVTVPYLTAAIELEDPYLAYPENGAEVTLHDKYPFLLTKYSVPAEPPAPTPTPTPLSPKWFKNVKAPPMPPAFQVGFPWNILLVISLPVVIPTFVIFRLAQVTSNNLLSQKRIKDLEAHESHQSRLVHILVGLEKKVEDEVVDIMENQGNSTDDSPPIAEVTGHIDNPVIKQKKAAKKPTLTEAQKEIILWLNTLPNLKKERAFIHTVSNSHPVIVCREMERWKIHDAGLGILRHWADNFVY